MTSERWWSVSVTRVNPTGAGPVGWGGDTAAPAAAGAISAHASIPANVRRRDIVGRFDSN